jgi:hypothetical protein
MAAMSEEIVVPMSIVVEGAPRGVAFCLQEGKDDLREVAWSGDEPMRFRFTVRAQAGGAWWPRLLGPYTQGPVTGRFVYLRIGTMAGDHESCWTRRAKVPLRPLSWAQLQEAASAPGGYLEGRIAGTARDGGPCCASVPLLDGGWVLRRD